PARVCQSKSVPVTPWHQNRFWTGVDGTFVDPESEIKGRSLAGACLHAARGAIRHADFIQRVSLAASTIQSWSYGAGASWTRPARRCAPVPDWTRDATGCREASHRIRGDAEGSCRRRPRPAITQNRDQRSSRSYERATPTAP